MKLGEESADTGSVIPLLRDGLIRGVTPNTSIIARDGLSNADLPRLY